MQTLYGNTYTRYFATHMEGIQASGFASVGGTPINDVNNPHYADFEPDITYWHSVPDNYIEVFSVPGAAWHLYNFDTNTWTERDYPEDWNGLTSGETS